MCHFSSIIQNKCIVIKHNVVLWYVKSRMSCFNLFSVILSDLKREVEQDPLLWSVADVTSYFTSVGFPEQALAFRTQVSPVVNQTCQENIRTLNLLIGFCIIKTNLQMFRKHTSECGSCFFHLKSLWCLLIYALSALISHLFFTQKLIEMNDKLFCLAKMKS